MWSSNHDAFFKHPCFSKLQPYLNSSHMTEAGPLAEISGDEEEEEKQPLPLPGVRSGGESVGGVKGHLCV